MLILGVFGDDIERCEYSYLFAQKPWFEIVDGALALRNTPVPPGHAPVRLAAIRRVLSYSHLADFVFSRAGPAWWHVEGAKRRQHDRGAARLPALDALAAHGRELGIDVVDLAPTLLAMIRSDKGRWPNATGHFSSEANAWVAAQIAERLR